MKNNNKISGLVKLATLVCTSIFMSTIFTAEIKANIVGSDQQNFNPSSNPNDFVTVRSSKILLPGQFSLGLFSDFAQNTLPYDHGSDVKAGKFSWNDTLWSSDLGLSYGVIENLELGLNLPMVLSQTQKNENSHGYFADKGFTGLRLHGKYRWITWNQLGLATVINIYNDMIRNSPYRGDKSSILYSLEMVLDYYFLDFGFASNFGYKWRSAKFKSENITDERALSNQLLYSFAISYNIAPIRHQLIGEIYGSTVAEKRDEFADRDTSNRELNLSLKNLYSDNLFFNYGIGTELNHGVATPDLRFFAGVQYTFASQSLFANKSSSLPSEEKPKETIVLQDVFFELNSSTLSKKSESLKTIDEVGLKLSQSNPFQKLVIEGHTCNIGSEKYNTRLSAKRAQAIKKYLITKYKLPNDKILIAGRGESYPVASNETELGREQNRRVEFKIF